MITLTATEIWNLVKRKEYHAILDLKKNRIGVKQISFIVSFPDEATHKHAQLADDDQIAWTPINPKTEEVVVDLTTNSKTVIIPK